MTRLNPVNRIIGMRFKLYNAGCILFLFLSCVSQENQVVLEQHSPQYTLAPLYTQMQQEIPHPQEKWMKNVFPEGQWIETTLPQGYYWAMEDQEIQSISAAIYPKICPDIYQLGNSLYVLLSWQESPDSAVRRSIFHAGTIENPMYFSLEELQQAMSPEELKKPVVILDPGHGGRDPGALGSAGFYEKYYNQRLAEILGKELSDRGYVVLYTYDPAKDQSLSLDKRIEFAGFYRNAVFISLHHNSSYDESDRGFSLFFSSFHSDKPTETSYVMVDGKEETYLGERIQGDKVELFYENEEMVRKSLSLSMEDPHVDAYVRDRNPDEIARQSYLLALVLYHHLNRLDFLSPYYYNHRLVDERDYRVLEENPNVAILLETGFISNPEEAQLLKQLDKLQQLASVLADGIDSYSSSAGREATRSLK